jgi:hypothetical protein
MWVVLHATHLMYSSGGSCVDCWSFTPLAVGVEVPSGVGTWG